MWPERAATLSTPHNCRLHGTSAYVLIGSLWSLQYSPLSPYLSTHSPRRLPALMQDCCAPLSFCLHFLFSGWTHLPALSTCFILTLVAVLGETPHCLGLIRHQSWKEETDLNYLFHSLTASRLSPRNSSWEPFICTHTKKPFLSQSYSVILLSDLVRTSTNFAFFILQLTVK